MSDRFTVTALESKQHGLPEIGFSVDLTMTGFSASKFPDPDVYAHLSGPPGGPLSFRFAKAGGNADFVSAVGKYAGDPNVEVGPKGEVEVAGLKRPAIVVYSGQAHPMTSMASCAIAFPTPVGPLLLIFGSGGTPQTITTPAEVAKHESIATVLRSFRLE